MDSSIVFTKTAKGVQELKHHGKNLPALLAVTLGKVDGRSTVGALVNSLTAEQRATLEQALSTLESQQFIRIFVRAPDANALPDDELPEGLPVPALQVEELDAYEGTLAWSQARRGVQQLVQEGFFETPDRIAKGAAAQACILIVEDDDAIAQLMQVFLSRQGYQVSTVADGRDALHLLDAGPPPDLVLLDVNLPHVNGFDILTYIRSHEPLRQVPAIMVTAQVSDADVLRGLRGGADGYIFKPFEWKVLLDGIKRVLGH